MRLGGTYNTFRAENIKQIPEICKKIVKPPFLSTRKCISYVTGFGNRVV
jgi:hypothetical protein